MSWLTKISQENQSNGWFSLNWAKDYKSFYTLKQPSGKLVHITHVTDLKNKNINTLPKDAIYIGVVQYPIINGPEWNLNHKIIPIVNGNPIRDFYDKEEFGQNMT